MHPGSAGKAGPPPPLPQKGPSGGAAAGLAPLQPGPRALAAQSGMENFRKVKTSEEDSALPFEGLPSDVVEMKVKEGSKIRNLMGFAVSRMELEATRQIVFSGCGRAVTKTITCVEILKRKLGGLHQVTRIQYRTMLEVWESQEEGSAERLTAHKNVPSVCILLSKDALDPHQRGYQPPEPPGVLWRAEEGPSREDPSSASPQAVKRRLAVPHKDEQLKKPAQEHAVEQNVGPTGRFGP